MIVPVRQFDSELAKELLQRAARVRELLEEAAVFERACDFTGAVAKARYAAEVAADPDSRDEAILALERHRANERAWQAEIVRRQDAFEAREQASTHD